MEKRDGVTTENVLNRECDANRMTNAQALEACRVDVLTEGKQLANIGHDRGQRALDAMRRLAELVSLDPAAEDAGVRQRRLPDARSATPSSPRSRRPWQPAR